MAHDFDPDSDSARTAENLMLVRSLRADVFPSEIFDEHAWNMMLRLFVAQARNHAVTESDLIALTGTPREVGQRWLAHLVADTQVEPYTEGGVLALTRPAFTRMEGFLRKASRVHKTDGPT